ncbi:hypothetical protein [Candidatus Nitrososphaera evergladensis]|nr:hypothetical protein [Candidatus Nitrososphaera evergladensis]
MVQVIKTETALAGNNTGSADKDIAIDHIEHASEALTNSTLKEIAERNQRLATDLPASIEQLRMSISSGVSASQIEQDVKTISDLLDETVQVRIEKSQLTNSTVQAVIVANLVNEALEHYGEAIGYEGNMTDMSSMAGMTSSMSGNESSTTSSSMSMNTGSSSNSGSTQGMNSSNISSSSGSSGMSMSKAVIVSEANYQSAKAFAQKAWGLYQQIKPQATDGGSGNSVEKLDKSFPAFLSAIESKASAMDIMSIAHLQIHPNLMTAYNLQVVPEFPIPLLISLPALAAAVLYGRFRMNAKNSGGDGGSAAGNGGSPKEQ